MKFIALILISGMLSACTVSGDPWYVSEDVAVPDIGPPDIGPPADVIETDEIGGPPDEITWMEHVLPIFEGKCVPCHEGGPTAFLTDSAVLDQSPAGSFGCPTDISMSACILELVDGQAMPLGCKDDKCVIGDDLELVKAWIDGGALLGGEEPPPPPPPTWTDDILPVLGGYCVPCHEGGATAFLKDSSVLENAPSGSFGCSKDISMPACLLQLSDEQAMPLGCKDDKCVSASDLELMKAWVDGGAAL